MTTPRTVGVLGGMGPEATVLFMRYLLDVTPAEDDRDHVPLLVDSNTQVPSRIRRLIERDGEDPGPVLVDMARRLETAGAEALVMPCNTAHAYTKQIQEAVGIPFLSVIEGVARTLEQRAGPSGKVGILGSPAIRFCRIFDSAIESAGYEPVYPEDEAVTLNAIRRIKAGETDRDVIEIDAVSDAITATNAEIVLVACSEFSLFVEDFQRRMETDLIDTMRVLARRAKEFSIGTQAEFDD